MKRSPIRWTIMVIVALLLAACGASGQSTSAGEGLLGQIKQRKTLVVGTSADYPPYESVGPDGQFVGYDMDIIREIGKRMGVEVKIQDLGFDSLIASLQEKKVDAVISAMQATPQRAEKVDFSAVYHTPKDAFLVSGTSTLTISDPKDAAGKAIGVQTGTAQEKWVMENLVQAGLTKEDQVFRYERVDDAARDLSNGRIEVLMILADAAQALVEKMGLKIALSTEKTIIAGQAIAMPKGEAALKAEIDRILAEMKQDGTLKKIQDQWGIP